MATFKLVGTELTEVPTPFIIRKSGKSLKPYYVAPHGGQDGHYFSGTKELATSFQTRAEAEAVADKLSGCIVVEK